MFVSSFPFSPCIQSSIIDWENVILKMVLALTSFPLPPRTYINTYIHAPFRIQTYAHTDIYKYKYRDTYSVDTYVDA